MLIALVLVCVFLFAVSRRRGRQWRLLAHLPTYSRLPLIGSAHHLFGDGRHIFLRLAEMSEISEKKDLPFVLWMGHCPCLVLIDLDDIRAVTNTYLERPYYYSFARVWLGDGLLTAPVWIWKRNIKKLAGTFSTTGLVDGFQDAFNNHARKLVQRLKTEAGKEPFDAMEKYLALTSLETICQIALGVSELTEGMVTKEYYTSFLKTLELLQTRGFNFLYHSDILFSLTPYKNEMIKSVKKLQIIAETALQMRYKGQESKQSNRLRDKQDVDTIPDNAKGNFKSYLDVLLQLHEDDPTFSEQQVKDEINTIILGGQETVASTLSYALLMIGCNPGVQDKLYAEMRGIFGDSKRDVGQADLARMPYCEAVILETLRLYPPVPAVLRVADRDLKLKSCTVPAGTNCVVNIYGAGRSPRQWGLDAAQFRPERWLRGRAGALKDLLAFSTGKRACIGKKYAMSMLKTTVAWCIRELELQSEAHSMQLKLGVALRPSAGHLLRVRLRPNGPVVAGQY